MLSHPRTVERRRRRLYVRVKYKVEVRFLHVPGGQAAHSLGREIHTSRGGLAVGWTEDLSAGGLRLKTPIPLAKGDYLSIHRFPPADGEEILARVARVLKDEAGEPVCYGLEFVGMCAALRSLITRRVYQQQRESLRSMAPPRSETS